MKTVAAVALLVLVLGLGGCGDDVSSEAPASDAGADGAVDAADSGEDAGKDAGRDAAPPWSVPEITYPDPDAAEPFYLSEVGLYVDIADKRIAPDLLPFEPQYVLWSDGADKRRWLRLPPGERIDSSDPDHWSFPVGTMLFKEFSREGKRIETRLIARTGEGDEDYFMGAFVWNDDESDARFAPGGEVDARGTSHDVPKVKFCFSCHNGDRGRVLGFSAVQQPDAPAELLSHAVPAGFAAPGDEVVSAALGYLHANCGHCHNPRGTSWPETDMDLRLRLSDARPEDTAAYVSSIAVDLQAFDAADVTKRVVPGDPEHSGLLYRMSMRGIDTQMPPLATEVVHEDGMALVRAWIEGLRP